MFIVAAMDATISPISGWARLKSWLGFIILYYRVNSHLQERKRIFFSKRGLTFAAHQQKPRLAAGG
jgi:hypothetical protein